MRVRLQRIVPEAGEARVVDEQGRAWRLRARDVDTDSAVAHQAWMDLLLALPEWFEVAEIAPGRVALHPWLDRDLEVDGEALPVRYRGWNHRGQANWHVIKHALHARSLRSSLGPEDWPADPGGALDRLRALHRRTGCRVHVWARRPGRVACGDCAPRRRATCFGAIYEEGWRPYDAGTREALRFAASPAGAELARWQEREGSRRLLLHDERATRAVVVLRGGRGGRRDAWSVTTYRLLPARAARTAEMRGELGELARKLAFADAPAEVPRAPVSGADEEE